MSIFSVIWPMNGDISGVNEPEETLICHLVNSRYTRTSTSTGTGAVRTTNLVSGGDGNELVLDVRVAQDDRRCEQIRAEVSALEAAAGYRWPWRGRTTPERQTGERTGPSRCQTTGVRSGRNRHGYKDTGTRKGKGTVRT
jgi:hypothetical protein